MCKGMRITFFFSFLKYAVYVMYGSRRGHNDIKPIIEQSTKIRSHFKNLYKFSHNSTTNENETLQYKNLCSIRDWFYIIF